MIQTKDLFQLQTELTDMKVDMAVSKAIDRVIEKINDLQGEINNLRHDMHVQISELRQEMHSGFLSLDKRVVAIETRLGITGKKQQALYDRAMDYLFKAGWGALTLAFAYLIVQFHLFVR